ncbi:hypothetical protein ACQEVS_32735 [Streptomyces sp. CA-181903]|uniref:hypothetical protein n=1 Tax=Streptomyces sp. CA-181903 TaxID=3240055 RepID=UPI003D91965E
MSVRPAYAAAADGLADRVLDALCRGTDGAGLIARYVDGHPDPLAALAAVRVVGADVFVPCLLAGAPLRAEDADAVIRSFTAFPVPPGGQASRSASAAWRDWATARLLVRLGADGAHRVAAPPPADDGVPGDPARWREWSLRMARLSPLATPHLDGPVRVAARGGAVALSRGLTRSLLRRDLPTAARLVRWLALLRHDGVTLPLDPAPALEHVALLAGRSPRTALDAAVAGRLPASGGPEAVAV